ncbi:glycosyltransferase [Ammoniphilus sp. CFH 90114]|uniref:glycosyltransferase n=1 Tax=Ammoniphilus sp. CFH 90114 TaxID=2493665 RepID=UPI00100FA894|nr:glycosyltransferase [Ammoniphilus sp. CFH 90114]RXT06401.1 colanic acid biosynthesis glycosyltransferase WcaL [Ammoniphilus sp. CFH 90114]
MARRRKVVAFVKTTYLNPTETFIYERIKNIRRFKGYFLTDKIKNRKKFPYPRIYKMRKIRNIPRFMKQKRTAVIQAFFGPSAIRILPYKRKTSIPLVSSFHGKDVSARLRERGYKRKLRSVFRHSSRVLVVSREMKRKLIRLQCPKRKIRVIKTGIDLKKFPFKLRRPPRKNNITFLSIGRLVPKKGMDILVQAFARVHRKYPKTRLIIVGDGSMRSKLRRMIRKRGLKSCVTLKGKLSHKEVRKELKKAHVFVLASRTARNGDKEGIPNSLVEAMASGLPAISTNHSGIPELIKDGKTGFLAKQGSIRSLTKQMIRMIKQKKKWRKLTRSARAFIEKEHNIKKQVRKLERIYQKVAK